jgi:hypothetical protein
VSTDSSATDNLYEVMRIGAQLFASSTLRLLD